jgi:hypothetical protein
VSNRNGWNSNDEAIRLMIFALFNVHGLTPQIAKTTKYMNINISRVGYYSP